MKKAILIIFFLSSTILIQAQEKPFIFGLKAAPNIAWMASDSKGYESTGSELGFGWGFVADFLLMGNYYVGTGFNVQYINTGMTFPHQYETNNDLIEGTLERKYKMRYLQLPLMLKMKTNEFGNFRFYAQLGLGNGFVLNAKGDDTFTGITGQNIQEENSIKDQIQVYRGSLLIGAGLDYLIGESTFLTGGITFDNGFTDVLRYENKLDPTLKNDATNSFFELYIGIMF